MPAFIEEDTPIMDRIPPFESTHLEALCKVIADTSLGLKGSEIGDVLRECKVPDVSPEMTKWKRLYNALVSIQNEKQIGNYAVNDLTRAMKPVRFTESPSLFASQRDRVNPILAFSGMTLGNDGKVRRAVKATTLHGAVPGRSSSPVSGSVQGSGKRRFAVALSFPGEKREFVRSVAENLRPRAPVFYDHFFTAELARPDLDLHLLDIYRNQSDLLVVFLCAEYEKKDWCGLEWRAIRDLIKSRERDRVMFMRFDDADVSGVFSIDGYVDLRHRTAAQATELILERAGMLRA